MLDLTIYLQHPFFFISLVFIHQFLNNSKYWMMIASSLFCISPIRANIKNSIKVTKTIFPLIYSMEFGDKKLRRKILARHKLYFLREFQSEISLTIIHQLKALIRRSLESFTHDHIALLIFPLLRQDLTFFENMPVWFTLKSDKGKRRRIKRLMVLNYYENTNKTKLANLHFYL